MQGQGTPVAVGTFLSGSRGYDVAPDDRFFPNQLANIRVHRRGGR
jgi:hypothetical protein